MVTRNRMFGRSGGVFVATGQAGTPRGRIGVPKQALLGLVIAVTTIGAVAVSASALRHGGPAHPAVAGNFAAMAGSAESEPLLVVVVGRDWHSNPAARSLLGPDSIRTAAGLPVSAVIVDSESEAAAVVQAIRDSNAIRIPLGLPEIVVANLTTAP
jgi:hypothetical protein